MELESHVSFFKMSDVISLRYHPLGTKASTKELQSSLVTASISPLANSQIQAYLSPGEISVTVFIL